MREQTDLVEIWRIDYTTRIFFVDIAENGPFEVDARSTTATASPPCKSPYFATASSSAAEKWTCTCSVTETDIPAVLLSRPVRLNALGARSNRRKVWNGNRDAQLLDVETRRFDRSCSFDRSSENRSRCLQPTIDFAALLKLYKICTRVHRSKLKRWKHVNR